MSQIKKAEQMTMQAVDEASPPRINLVRHTQYMRKADLEKAKKVAEKTQTCMAQVIRDAVRAGLPR